VDAFVCRAACVRAITFDKWASTMSACILKPPDAEKILQGVLDCVIGCASGRLRDMSDSDQHGV
jgi:hypothetical protein